VIFSIAADEYRYADKIVKFLLSILLYFSRFQKSLLYSKYSMENPDFQVFPCIPDSFFMQADMENASKIFFN